MNKKANRLIDTLYNPSENKDTRPTWDEYFLDMATLTASRSRDSTPVVKPSCGVDRR